MSTERTENDSIIQFATERATPQVVTLKRGTSDEAQVLFAPRGMESHSVKALLDPYLPKPERRRGTTTLTDPASFAAFVARAKGDGTVLYLDDTSDRPSLTAVFDHDLAGPDGAAAAQWGQHRAFYALDLSDEWKAWTKADNATLTQRDFAEFVEDRALDLVDPADVGDSPTVALAEKLGLTLATAREVIEASRGLKLRADVNVGETIALASGETELHYAEAHKGVDGQPLVVPSAFLIAVPVLRGAPRDVLLVRLRYRRVQGQPRVTWSVNLHRPDAVLRDAVNEVAADVRAKTGVDLFRGVAPKPGA